MARRCGAAPTALEAIGRSARDREDRLLRAASMLGAAADDLRTIGPPRAASLDALARAIRARAHAGAELDRWVGDIGVALAAAGEGAGAGAGRQTVVFGDLDHARHVAVVVPGMGASLDDVAGSARDQAHHLYDAARALDPDVTVVAWLGYDAPGVDDVLLDDAAEQGGAQLAAYVADLHDEGDRTVTVVAHSYGSLVGADALRDGMAVDDVVFVGSPGVQASRADDLVHGRADVYAERAPYDVVALSEAFGPDPSDPRFGARRLATGPGVRGHTAYFDPGTVALGNLAAVVVQRDDLLDVEHPTAVERDIAGLDDIWAATVEAPIDRAQQLVLALDGSVDALEHALPSSAWSRAVDPAPQLRRAVVEETDRIVDITQRAMSPDFAGDLAADAWDAVFG